MYFSHVSSTLAALSTWVRVRGSLALLPGWRTVSFAVCCHHAHALYHQSTAEDPILTLRRLGFPSRKFCQNMSLYEHDDGKGYMMLVRVRGAALE